MSFEPGRYIPDKIEYLLRQKRYLKNNRTPAEKRFSKVLKACCDMAHADYRQQQVFFDRPTNKGYIVDFIVYPHQIVFEVDGEAHKYSKKDDELRDKCLTKHGYCVARIQNDQVFDNGYCIDFICKFLFLPKTKIQELKESVGRPIRKKPNETESAADKPSRLGVNG